MIPVRIFHDGQKLYDIIMWHKTNNLIPNLGIDIPKFFQTIEEKKWIGGTRIECDVFYFEKLEMAIIFKLKFG